jgi:hypothetical protein
VGLVSQGLELLERLVLQMPRTQTPEVAVEAGQAALQQSPPTADLAAR